MPSFFSHAIAAAAMGSLFERGRPAMKLLLLAAFCAAIPDADVLGFKLGVPYEHPFGHRGFTHSLTFSVLLGFLVTYIAYQPTKLFSGKGLTYALFFTAVTFSHALLDAMTSGGMGIAFFAPFDNTRHFFDFRPIKVSPLSISQFFSSWGWKVVKSEFIWIWLPSIGLIFASILTRK